MGVRNFLVAMGDQGFNIFLRIQKPQRVTLPPIHLQCGRHRFTGRGLSGTHTMRWCDGDEGQVFR